MKTTSELWHSPTLCGCVLRLERVWRVAQATVDRLKVGHAPQVADFWVRHLEESGQYDEVVEVPSIELHCPEHLHLDAQDLRAELLQWGQNVHSPDTCGCSLVFCYDKRAEFAPVPLDHPVYTRRCEEHAHLTDHVAHYHVVLAEHRKVNVARDKVSRALGVSWSEVKWSLDADRSVVVDHEHHGLTAEHVRSILEGP